MVLHDFWTFFIWSTVAGLAVIGIYQLLLLILRARGVFVTRTRFLTPKTPTVRPLGCSTLMARSSP